MIISAYCHVFTIRTWHSVTCIALLLTLRPITVRIAASFVKLLCVSRCLMKRYVLRPILHATSVQQSQQSVWSRPTGMRRSPWYQQLLISFSFANFCHCGRHVDDLSRSSFPASTRSTVSDSREQNTAIRKKQLNGWSIVWNAFIYTHTRERERERERERSRFSKNAVVFIAHQHADSVIIISIYDFCPPVRLSVCPSRCQSINQSLSNFVSGGTSPQKLTQAERKWKYTEVAKIEWTYEVNIHNNVYNQSINKSIESK